MLKFEKEFVAALRSFLARGIPAREIPESALQVARLLAHERMMKDPHQKFLMLITEARIEARVAKKRRSFRRVWPIEFTSGIFVKFFMTGPRWKSLFGVVERPIAEIDPIAAKYHRPGRKLLIVSLEEDIREITAEGWGAHEELRPGIRAEW